MKGSAFIATIEQTSCTNKNRRGGVHTGSGVIHIALIAFLRRILALPHVVTGVVTERRNKEAAHPQREGNAAEHQTKIDFDKRLLLRALLLLQTSCTF